MWTFCLHSNKGVIVKQIWSHELKKQGERKKGKFDKLTLYATHAHRTGKKNYFSVAWAQDVTTHFPVNSMAQITSFLCKSLSMEEYTNIYNCTTLVILRKSHTYMRTCPEKYLHRSRNLCIVKDHIISTKPSYRPTYCACSKPYFVVKFHINPGVDKWSMLLGGRWNIKLNLNATPN